ncbi:MAG: cytochrome c oxidase assembly protein [Methylohalobius sp.]|nr:cytochrome c oxidase assembly protein [Methylohalobius sp.]
MFKTAIPLALLGWLLPILAGAHGAFQEKDNFWFAWQFTPSLAIPLILITLVYLRGWQKRKRQRKPFSALKAGSFLSGVSCFVLALQSPIEPLSEHFLFVHQLEHMLLRVFGPLLIILAMPVPVLLAGLPSQLRHKVFAPLIRHRITKTLYRFFSQPLIASVLFVGTMIFWQIPSVHDASVKNEFVHDLMHFSMIVTSFFFWWLIADPRGSHARLSYALRLVILWAVTVPEALAGAYITLAKSPLYRVYDALNGRFSLDRLLDQQLGGILMWNDAMIGVIGMAVVFLLWIQEERPSKVALAKQPQRTAHP